MNRVVKVQHRLKFGRVLTYPVNGLARDLAGLLMRSTFSAENLSGLEKLGYVLEWVPRDLMVDAEGRVVTAEESPRAKPEGSLVRQVFSPLGAPYEETDKMFSNKGEKK